MSKSKNIPKPETYRAKIKRLALALPYEKRVEIMGYMNLGMTIGEAAHDSGVDQDTVVGVISLNIVRKTFEYFANPVV